MVEELEKQGEFGGQERLRDKRDWVSEGRYQLSEDS